jgi:hypothetical protein
MAKFNSIWYKPEYPGVINNQKLDIYNHEWISFNPANIIYKRDICNKCGIIKVETKGTIVMEYKREYIPINKWDMSCDELIMESILG